jgi:hypothetical protein
VVVGNEQCALEFDGLSVTESRRLRGEGERGSNRFMANITFINDVYLLAYVWARTLPFFANLTRAIVALGLMVIFIIDSFIYLVGTDGIT